MARTAASVTTLVRDSSVAVSPTGGTAATATGHYILGASTATGAAVLDARKFIISIGAASTAGTLTVRATGSGSNVAGVAQTSPYPSNAVFTQGSVGDLSVVYSTAVATIVGPFTSDRFLQTDGNIYLDWAGDQSAVFNVYELPFVVV